MDTVSVETVEVRCEIKWIYFLYYVILNNQKFVKVKEDGILTIYTKLRLFKHEIKKHEIKQ